MSRRDPPPVIPAKRLVRAIWFLYGRTRERHVAAWHIARLAWGDDPISQWPALVLPRLRFVQFKAA